MPSKATKSGHKTPSQLAAHTAKWAVTMAQVGIRQAIADNPWPHWEILKFTGPAGGEAKGVVDLIAVRKDHGEPFLPGTRRGDTLQIILIQAKGGSAARPTEDDAVRLRSVALHHKACHTLLAAWKKGTAAQFFSLRWDSEGRSRWDPVTVKDLKSIFGRRKEVPPNGLG